MRASRIHANYEALNRAAYDSGRQGQHVKECMKRDLELQLKRIWHIHPMEDLRVAYAHLLPSPGTLGSAVAKDNMGRIDTSETRE